MRIKMRERKRGMEEKKREKSVDVLDRLFWTVQPPMGLVKGDYYRAENWFAPHFPGDKGYHGILEVVRRDGTLQMVEFNEINNPTYYIRRYQGVSKRLSDYGFLQATKERTAKSGVVLVNGLTHLEEQMVAENRLTGEFDLLTGASNSIKRSMLPLAEEIAGRLDKPSARCITACPRRWSPASPGACDVWRRERSSPAPTTRSLPTGRRRLRTRSSSPITGSPNTTARTTSPPSGPGSTASSTCSAPGCWRPRASPT